jgi:hypothetical protein
MTTTIPALDIRGTVELPTGRTTFQKTGRGFGNISNGGKFDRQQRRHVIPADPKTPAQITRRVKLAAATNAWHSLTTPEKKAARMRGAARSITGFNQFISEYMKAP